MAGVSNTALTAFADIAKRVDEQASTRYQEKEAIVLPTLGHVNLHEKAHLARYMRARDVLKERLGEYGAIVDCSCGCGYGTALLSEAFPRGRVFGVDKEESLLRYAGLCYWSRNTSFHWADLDDDTAAVFVPLRNGLDAWVCLETIEHLQKPERLLRLIWTSLRRDGVLVLSAPKPVGRQSRFHLHKFKPDEMVEMLKGAGFAVVDFAAQERGEFGATPSGPEPGHFLWVARAK